MTLLAATLLGLGVVDIARWTLGASTSARTGAAAGIGVASVAVLAVLCVSSFAGGLAVVAVGCVAVLLWVVADAPEVRRSGTTALAVLAAIFAAVIVAVPNAPDTDGPLVAWYDSLPFPALSAVPVEQSLIALTGLVFLLSTANRIVRLVLAAAGTRPTEGEANLRGGRVLGPLERIFIVALAFGGDLTAAAVVIAAKGVLRLPEIRTAREEKSGGADVVAEYFLVGTFTSWLLAVGVAGLVALAG